MNDAMNMDAVKQQGYYNLIKAAYNSPNVVCKCGSKIFKEAVVLKKVSSLLSGTGKDELVPIPLYICAKCNEIPSEFLDKPAAKMILGETPDKTKTDSSILIK